MAIVIPLDANVDRMEMGMPHPLLCDDPGLVLVQYVPVSRSQIMPSLRSLLLNAHAYSHTSKPMNCNSLSLSSWSFSAVIRVLPRILLQNIIVCVAFSSFRLNHLW